MKTMAGRMRTKRQTFSMTLLVVAVTSVSIAVSLRVYMDRLSPTTQTVLINQKLAGYEVYLRFPKKVLDEPPRAMSPSKEKRGTSRL
ncbi:MAG: hypothetical protein AAGB04_09005 [Pseudomonadota bacterium]